MMYACSGLIAPLHADRFYLLDGALYWRTVIAHGVCKLCRPLCLDECLSVRPSASHSLSHLGSLRNFDQADGEGGKRSFYRHDRCCFPIPRLVLRTVAGGATPSMSAFPRCVHRFRPLYVHNKRLDGNPETWKIFRKFQPSVWESS